MKIKEVKKKEKVIDKNLLSAVLIIFDSKFKSHFHFFFAI